MIAMTSTNYCRSSTEDEIDLEVVTVGHRVLDLMLATRSALDAVRDSRAL